MRGGLKGAAARTQVLVIVAASHLDAVTFQICSQAFKILPTAVFAALLLGQKLTGLQWASLPVLAAGITFITLTGGSPPGARPAPALGPLPSGAGLLHSRPAPKKVLVGTELALCFTVQRPYAPACCRAALFRVKSILFMCTQTDARRPCLACAGGSGAAGGEHRDLVTGITASALSGLSSAFAGVYFEK